MSEFNIPKNGEAMADDDPMKHVLFPNLHMFKDVSDQPYIETWEMPETNYGQGRPSQQQQQNQMPQQGQYGGGPMAQQFGLSGVPQAQAAMVPAPQPMMPAQQSAQQAAMLPGTPISAMT
jgi:hypothetical protein